MEKIKAAIIGYGNIGKYVLEALETAPDFEVAGIVRRNGDVDCPKELQGYKIVRKISELPKPDVALVLYSLPHRQLRLDQIRAILFTAYMLSAFRLRYIQNIPFRQIRLTHLVAASFLSSYRNRLALPSCRISFLFFFQPDIVFSGHSALYQLC